jgi:hypothetical protein
MYYLSLGLHYFEQGAGQIRRGHQCLLGTLIGIARKRELRVTLVIII